jgi:hypothetical protein
MARQRASELLVVSQEARPPDRIRLDEAFDQVVARVVATLAPDKDSLGVLATFQHRPQSLRPEAQR